MTVADRIIKESPRRCIGREIVVVRPGSGRSSRANLGGRLSEKLRSLTLDRQLFGGESGG